MRHVAMRYLTAAIVLVVLAARAGGSTCMGDLNADGRVQVEEVVHMVACALGDAPCGGAHIRDVVQAVGNAMYGCDTVRLSKPACYQCEPCPFAINGIFSALDQVVSELEAEGITVIEANVEPVEITCLACGVCPAGFIFQVLVPEHDRARLLELGWQ
jgi:hypothetical protein